MADKHLPEGIELTALDERFREDPYPILARLRKAAPVHWDTQLKQYVVTRYDDVRAVLRDPQFWSDPRKANPGSFTHDVLAANIPEHGQPSMLQMDEPDHRRLRSLVSTFFTPAAVGKWQSRIRGVVQQLLNGINTDEFDLIAEFANPMPTIVIAELLGIDSEKHGAFKKWSDGLAQGAFSPFPTEDERQAQEQAAAELNAFFKEQIRSPRPDGEQDLLSAMVQAEQSGDRLTEDEILQLCILLLTAGNVTTTDLIGNGVKALLHNRDQWNKLTRDPGLAENAVEEILRFDSPVTVSGRIANRNLELAGVPVEKGAPLVTSLAAANHDLDLYDNPTVFDIEREDTRHHSFGGGRHLCLGAHLARLEAQEALLGLAAKYPNLKPSEKGFEYHANPSFRGMSSFWVRTF